MEIFKNEKHLRVVLDEKKNHIIFYWSNMAIPLDLLKEGMLKVQQVVEKKNVKTLIAETSNAKSILFPECIEWWANEMVPEYSKSGVKQIFTVKGGSALTRMTNERWHNVTDGINLYDVSSLQEVDQIISDLN